MSNPGDPVPLLAYSRTASRDAVALRLLGWIGLVMSLLLISRLLIYASGVPLMELPPWLYPRAQGWPGWQRHYAEYWYPLGRSVNALILLAGSIGILRRRAATRKWLLLFAVVEVGLAMPAIYLGVLQMDLLQSGFSTSIALRRDFSHLVHVINGVLPMLVLPAIFLCLSLGRAKELYEKKEV